MRRQSLLLWSAGVLSFAVTFWAVRKPPPQEADVSHAVHVAPDVQSHPNGVRRESPAGAVAEASTSFKTLPQVPLSPEARRDSAQLAQSSAEDAAALAAQAAALAQSAQ